jgi:tetratricopeptide (TPR) repeat protein
MIRQRQTYGDPAARANHSWGRKRLQIVCLVSWISIGALLGLAGDNRCFGKPPAKTTSTDANSFAALARDIEKSVVSLGYPESTADDLVRLVRGWKCEVWKQKLSQAHSASKGGQTAEIARAEEEVAKALYVAIGKEFSYANDEKMQYYHLARVIEDKKAQCVGFTQLFYILGNSTGLAVGAINVLELASHPLPPGVGHVACLVSMSDGKVMIVDLAGHYVSKPFVFKTAYVESGNCWQIKNQENPLKIFPRIQVLNGNELAGDIFTNLAYDYTKIGHRDQSASYSNTAIELDPKNATAFLNRGSDFSRRGKHQQAISDYSKAIELDPKMAEAFSNRGTEYAMLGNKAAAKKDLQTALQLKPAMRPEILKVSKHFKLGL